MIVVNHVTVTAGHGTEPCIEAARHLLGPSHTDIAGQILIRTHHPGVHGSFYQRIEMHDLGTRMNERIGTSSTTQRDRMPPGDLAQGVF